MEVIARNDNDEERQVCDYETKSTKILRRLGRDVMKYYLKENRIKEAKSLVELFE